MVRVPLRNGYEPYQKLIARRLRNDWVWLFRVDAEVLDGFVEDLRLDFAVEV